MSEPLLCARFSAGYGARQTLRDFELSIGRGEIHGLAGESGSGKSTVALALMRLLEFRGGWARGEIRLDGADLLALQERSMRSIRGLEAALVMQSPISALNPAMTIGGHFRECVRAHRADRGARPAPDFPSLLDMVGLPAERAFLDRYPRQLSVGQAQRAAIAMAVLHRPKLLIADEPTSALDTVNQARTLHLFSKLSRELGMSVLFISHDLLSVASLCSRISILEQGVVVEAGTTREIFNEPRHPYTQTLLAAIPEPAFVRGRRRDNTSLSGVNANHTMSAGTPALLSLAKRVHELGATWNGRKTALERTDHDSALS